MKNFRHLSKYLIALLWAVFTFVLFAQAITIPVSLNNAVQYIRDTFWTADGTSGWVLNASITQTGFYIRTGFLIDGTSWNNKFLWVDTTGNVVYVTGSLNNNPYFSLLGDYIPKLNAAGNDLVISSMYQNASGSISVNHTGATRSFDILGDFVVKTTAGSNVQYDYTYINSNTGLGYPSVDANTAPRCSCDTNLVGADCTIGTFTVLVDEGPYCIDATVQDPNNVGFYHHNVYTRNIIGIPTTVLTTSGENVGIRTDDPLAALHVQSGAVLFNGNVGTVPDLGTGTRFVWMPSKAATRIGYIEYNYWDDAQVWPFTSVLGWENNAVVWGTHSLIVWGSGNGMLNGTGNIIVGWFNNNVWWVFGSFVGFVWWGSDNTANGGSGLVVVGWYANQITKQFLWGTQPHYAAIVGWHDNMIYEWVLGFIGWWSGNLVQGNSNTIWWGWGNSAYGSYGFIGWGNSNTVNASNATIAGWITNQINANGINSTIWWGQQNTINLSVWDSSTIAWGKENTITAQYATIAGWWLNTISGISAFIGWWYQNAAWGQNSVIAGGENNIANGAFATIPWGHNNDASGNYSFAAGQNAIASGDNSFLWADGTSAYSLYDNEFQINSDRIMLWGWSPFYSDIGLMLSIFWIYSLYDSYDIQTFIQGSVGTQEIYAYSWYISNLYTFNGTVGVSDARLKNNVVSGSNRGTDAMTLLNALEPVTYNWASNSYTMNSPLNTTDLHYGFIAQQVETVLPDLVSEFDSSILGYQSEVWSINFKWVDTVELIPILVQAIKDLEARVAVLEAN